MRKSFSEQFRLFLIVPILLLILTGCDKDFDNVVDVTPTIYQVTGISSFSSFTYIVGDSTLTLSLNLNSSENVSAVFVNVIASDGNQLNNSPVDLLDNGNPANGDQVAGDNKYTNRFPLSRQNPVGLYRVNFFITDTRGETELAAVQQFNYDNGQNNVAPVISSLIIPDSVAKGVPFNFSIMVTDSNGLSDVSKDDGVFFHLYRPDSTIVAAGPFYMHDDGDPVFGDSIANDGIFSFRNSFLDDSTTQTGNWRFLFQAKDRGGLLSNIIEQLLFVTE
jgi:hypothetical protein